jgi:diadenosine tetraphosphate (Ap4A) HIT family hydrolase
MTGCDFCTEFASDSASTFARIYEHDPESRILRRSSEFVVLPSLGQIVEGYLLVVPTKHRAALGDLPALHVDELTVLCAFVRATIESEYGPCVFYEHGTRSEKSGGCGIYHAHLHAVPLSRAMDPVDLLKSKFSTRALTNLGEIRQQTQGLPSYLFYQDSLGNSYVFDTGNLPSQYMRKLLANRIGNPQWDWRTAGKEERLLATLNCLSKRFEADRIPGQLQPDPDESGR